MSKAVMDGKGRTQSLGPGKEFHRKRWTMLRPGFSDSCPRGTAIDLA